MAYVLNKKLCPAGLKNNPNRNMAAIEYITVHCTGNYSATATAKSHANYLFGGSGGGQTSWHYTVDDKEIWQSFEDNQACWHAGDGSGKGNNASIGIEICVNDKAVFVKACENAAELVADLLAKHNLPIERVKQHNNWSGKDCPKEIRSGSWGITWAQFLEKVNASISPKGTPIIGNPSAAVEKMVQWAKNKGTKPFFIDLAQTFYKVALSAGVDPVVVYCQSAKETGYGKFGGVLDETYCNPCGMKNSGGGGDYDPNAHMRFASWEQGIQAQVDHLALYAGAPGYPKTGTPDPRHFPYLLGTAKTVEKLGGKWAPSVTYGDDIVRMMNEVKSTIINAPPPDEPSAWAKPAWNWAKENKITDGTNPQESATREQVVTLIYNAIKTIE